MEYIPDCINHFLINELTNQGFSIENNIDFTANIRESAKRIYYAALLGAPLSMNYNLFHAKLSRFAKTHYLSGYYQYKELKEMLWEYHSILAIKK